MPKIYTDADLAEARKELARIEADDGLRGRSPGQHRSSLAGARARIDTITRALGRVGGQQMSNRSGTQDVGG